MKFCTRMVVLLLCVCLMGLAISPVAYAGTPDDFTLSVDKATVDVGETVTVTISNCDTSFSAMTLVMKFDNSVLQCTGLTNVDGDDGDDDLFMYYLNSKGKPKPVYPNAGYCTVDDINENSQFQFLILGTEDVNYVEGEVVIFTFEAITEGTVDISLKTTVVDANGEIAKTVTSTVTVGTTEPEHTCTLTSVEGQPATCEDAGYEAYYQCSDETCGKLYSDAEGTNEITEPVVIPAKGHGKTNGFRYEHTAGTDTHNVVCADCQKVVEEGVACTFEVGSHVCKFDCGNETVCNDGDDDHYCDVCSTKLSDCDDKDNDGDHNCDICGKADITQCYGGTATCEDPAVCEECHNPYGTATGHGKIYGFDYEHAGTKTHSIICNDCDETVDTVACTFEEGGHDCTFDCGNATSCTDVNGDGNHKCDVCGESGFTACYGGTATCLEPAVCSECGQEYGDKDSKNHVGEQTTKYTDNGDTHTVTVTCECDGIVSTETVPHTYGKDFDCDDCGHVLSGWQYKQGDWYYVVDGEPVTGNVRVPYPTDAINGVTYGPNAEDVAYAQENDDSKYTDADTAVFVFGEDGKFQQTTGIVDGNRYAVNGMIGWHVGLVEVDGEYYYFIGDEAGNGNIAAEGDTYLTRTNGIEGFEPKDIYNFEGGKFSGLNGLVDRYGDGVLYYYENSKLMVGNGLTKIGDQYVYVRSTNGQIVVGKKWWVAKTNSVDIQPGLYTFDENGFLQTAKDPSVNGLEDGVYYKDGMPYYAGLIEIDGDIYYINSAGEAVTGTYYITKIDNYTGSLEFARGDKLTFGADGKLILE